MQEAPYERLRELRIKKGYRTQKHFCAHARRYGYKLELRRYGGIERGDITPNIGDIMTICRAMEISADSWLFGYQDRVDTRMLDDNELRIVRDLVHGLLGLRQ